MSREENEISKYCRKECAYLERQIVPIANVSRKLDNYLHPLYLPLDGFVEIVGVYFRKKQEVDGAGIDIRIRGDELA